MHLCNSKQLCNNIFETIHPSFDIYCLPLWMNSKVACSQNSRAAGFQEPSCKYASVLAGIGWITCWIPSQAGHKAVHPSGKPYT